MYGISRPVSRVAGNAVRRPLNIVKRNKPVSHGSAAPNNRNTANRAATKKSASKAATNSGASNFASRQAAATKKAATKA